MRVAIVVNESARRGSGDVARAARRELPHARVLLSRTLDDLQSFANELHAEPPDLILSAGGDGTAIALLNALRRAGRRVAARNGRVNGAGAEPVLDAIARSQRSRLGPVVGVLKLGTGNAWARVTGAPPWKSALHLLRSLMGRDMAPPVRSFDLVDVEGQVAHFTGTGWDAEMVHDFHAQKTGPGILPESRRHGLMGYLQALMMRTVPRNLSRKQTEVEIINTGAEAMTIDANARPVRMPGATAGETLYAGPTSVCAVGTTPEWGFGFRAFPFAGLTEGRLNLRNYAAGALEGLMHSPGLWRGAHPMPKMGSWFVTRARLNFSRKVPFQIGGDLFAERDTIDYAIAPEYVDLVDWTALARGARGVPQKKRDRLRRILLAPEP